MVGGGASYDRSGYDELMQFDKDTGVPAPCMISEQKDRCNEDDVLERSKHGVASTSKEKGAG